MGALGLTRRSACLLVAALCVLLGTFNQAWMARNGYFESGQPQEYAANRVLASEVLNALKERDIQSVYFFHGHHGPLLPLATAAIALITGDELISPTTMCLSTGWLFGCLTLIGAYRLARSWVSRSYALLACALVAGSPIIVCYLRPYFQQGPMCALVLLAWAELIRTKGFT